MAQQATILNVQRFTLHDGPGIRTEFFLKGCPLRCDWCGNPESFTRQPEVGVFANRCISSELCDDCKLVCHDLQMLIFTDSKLDSIDRKQCSSCLECAQVCPSEAIRPWGHSMTVDECMKVIIQDRGFYERSGGGVTVSGGEPLLQSDFVGQLFKACKQQGIHTCLESSLYANWNKIESLLPVTDLFISDLKLMDSQRHKQYTGVDNHKILENLITLSATNKPLILRIPVIPNINDDEDNIKASADFILQQMQGKVRTLQLLSFMRLGEEKYQSLGLPYKMQDLKFDRAAFQKKVEKIAVYFNQRGIHCMIGAKEKAEL
ncbi:glycyl-radical enzyme activating protein [Alginatibacterium sediminis]|uniref:Glycyl-radical enzyme activating protein n=1 Tax=Alginatibacterium sediminis TaxID=2164068 RepID=A0A420EJJ4_9ALTE|nr:glycyl-radical enzyme activating protein [Alginatibacterium sediminis]RKF20891.1 glycyl-radical enzyme activating protein [Alginatibacterium sediminis]